MPTRKKWYDNQWILRGLSLVFAVMLFAVVRSSGQTTANLSRLEQSASVETSETISNVPVQLGAHDDDIFVSQLPETVSVTLTGPRNLVTQLANTSLQVTTEDLTGTTTGQRTVRLEVTGLPDGVDYQVNPSRVVVNIARKKTITVPIEYELASDLLASGQEVESVSLSVSEVTLTGNEETVDKVAKALIKITSSTPVDQSFTAKYKLQVVDKDGKLLDVNPSVSEVEAKVTLASLHTRSVDLLVVATGENQNYQYNYQIIEGTQATIQGTTEALDAVKSIRVAIDVSNLTSSSTVTGRLEVPNGVTVTSVNPVQVSVTVVPVAASSASSAASSDSSNESSVSVPMSSNQTTESESADESSSAANPQ